MANYFKNGEVAPASQSGMSKITWTPQFGAGYIQSERPCLQQQIRKWQHDDRVAAVAPCKVEDEYLFLPSNFKIGNHHCDNLEQLIVEEIKLQEGQAHDALHDLRAAIKHG